MPDVNESYWISYEISWIGGAIVAVAAGVLLFAAWRRWYGMARPSQKSN